MIDRLITRGTRGIPGRQWCERIWTTRATCAQKGQRLFHFIREAVQAHFAGTPAPQYAEQALAEIAAMNFKHHQINSIVRCPHKPCDYWAKPLADMNGGTYRAMGE